MNNNNNSFVNTTNNNLKGNSPVTPHEENITAVYKGQPFLI